MEIKSFIILFCLLKLITGLEVGDIGCGNAWVPFGEEKCYLLVAKQIATWVDGVGICGNLDTESNATLAMIKSKEEQDFIEDYLINKMQVLENVWIGAKRSNENSEFRWVDGSKLEYQHFKKGEPDNSKNKNCLQFIANRDLLVVKDETSLGKWSNTECQRHNLNVLCQKTQDITFAKLTEIVFEMRKKYEKEKKELKDNIAEMQTVESDLKHKIEEMESVEKGLINTIGELKTNETSLKDEINVLKEEIGNKTILKTAPPNMIYVQYPNELEPSKVWDCANNKTWEDISSQYAGHFFRVLGRNSAAWGSIQQPSSPYLKTLRKWSCGGSGDACPNGPQEEIHARLGHNSDSYLYISHNSDSGLDFVHSNDEVKPINMAIKIWKCSEA